MKLLVCCLLAITCVLVDADKGERILKLTEVIKELKALNRTVTVGQPAIYLTLSQSLCVIST